MESFIMLRDAYSAPNFSPQKLPPDVDKKLVLLNYLFAATLNDAVIQLEIFKSTTNRLQKERITTGYNILLKEKFSVKFSIDDELDKFESSNLHDDKFKLDKLVADRRYITHVLTDTYMNLISCVSFRPMQSFTIKWRKRVEYLESLKRKKEQLTIQRRELYKKLRHQRTRNTALLYDIAQKIEQKRKELEDKSKNIYVEERYCVNWERSRGQQYRISMDQKEATISSFSETKKNMIKDEQLVHDEIDLYMNIQIHNALSKQDKWAEHYDKDLEAIDVKIAIKTHSLEDERKRRRSLEYEYEKREKEMKEWLQFKLDKQQAILHSEKMHRSAIAVQAWWRGVLVRKQLGPFGKSTEQGKSKQRKFKSGNNNKLNRKYKR